MRHTRNRTALVIGAGAVGQIIAAHLHEAGFELELIDKRHWAHFNEHGIRIRGLKKMDVPDVTAQQSLDLSNISNPSVVFVAVKTPFLEVVLDELKRLPPSVPIVLAENGLDAERLAVASLPNHPIARMIINFAGSWRPDRTIHYAWFQPPNYVGGADGELSPWVREIADDLTGAGLETEATADIRTPAWRKVLMNAALGGLCAVTNQKMSSAMADPETRWLFENLLDEGIEAAVAEGVELGDGYREHAIEYCKKGGDHLPSIAVDLIGGLPTEIDECNGRIAAVGRDMGLEMPYHQTMTILIHTAEARRQAELRADGLTRRVNEVETEILSEMPDVDQVVIVNRPGEALAALIFPHLDPFNTTREDCSKYMEDCAMRCAECTIGESFTRQLRTLRAHLGPLGAELRYFMLLPGENPIERGDLTKPLTLMRENLAERFASEIDALANPDAAPFELARKVVEL